MTYWEKNSSGVRHEYASHGIDEETGAPIILPQERIEYFEQECGAKMDQDMLEWVMDIK
jgi:hypothetical protein